jgi:hypothetical protein
MLLSAVFALSALWNESDFTFCRRVLVLASITRCSMFLGLKQLCPMTVLQWQLVQGYTLKPRILLLLYVSIYYYSCRSLTNLLFSHDCNCASLSGAPSTLSNMSHSRRPRDVEYNQSLLLPLSDQNMYFNFLGPRWYLGMHVCMSASAWTWLTMDKLMTHVEVWALLYLRQRSRSVTCMLRLFGRPD